MLKQTLLIIITCILLAGISQADQIDLTVTYEGTIYGKRPEGPNGDAISVLTDDYFPQEGIWDGGDSNPAPDRWNGENTVTFYTGDGDNEFFYFDLGGTYLLEDAALSVDNNDSYFIEYWSDGAWLSLFTVLPGYGEINRSMDTLSTDSSLIFHNQNEYESRIVFDSVETTQLKLYATSTDGGNFALGEFQVFGTAIQVEPSPTPEPTTLLLFGLGLLGVAGVSRKQ